MEARLRKMYSKYVVDDMTAGPAYSCNSEWIGVNWGEEEEGRAGW